MSLPENETTVNLKSASFIVIMHLHEGLTHIQSQIKPWLLSGESFTLTRKLQWFHFLYICVFNIYVLSAVSVCDLFPPVGSIMQ